METERVLGIDLGTTNSCAAVLIDGEVHVIPDEEGRRLQSSLVHFREDGSLVIGNMARAGLISDPKNTIFSSKRLLGWPFDSIEAKQLRAQFPYQVKQGERQSSLIEVHGESYALPEIAALIIHRMRDLAERYLQGPVTRAVITVPANFNDTQRQLTKLAGELAGLDVLRILNEPTAAALAYGYGRGLDARLAIYDLGGGTFDLTLLQLDGNLFEVIGTAGDSYLGGDDFDQAIVQLILLFLKKQYQFTIDENPHLSGYFKQLAEQIKIGLTTYERLQIDEQIQLRHGEALSPLKLAIGRDLLKKQCRELVERSLKICEEALSQGGIDAREIDDVILVGGSSRSPVIAEMVNQYFGRPALSDIDPDEVVAIGAAIQGSLLATNFSESYTMIQPLLLDVTPSSLGVLTVEDIIEPLIPRNTTVPCQHTRTFTTTSDLQESVKIQIFQGESRFAGGNVKLGEVELCGLRPAARGDVSIDVTFEIDTDGILCVTAKDNETGLMQEARVQVSAGYSQDTVEGMRRPQRGA